MGKSTFKKRLFAALEVNRILNAAETNG